MVMENTVETFTDRILTSFTKYADTYSGSIDHLIGQITNIKTEILCDLNPDDEVNIPTVLLIEKWLDKTRDVLNQMGVEHRNIHGVVSKCGREIDKYCTTDISIVCPRECNYEKADSRERVLLNKLVASHLLTHGYLEIAECLAEEAGIDLDEANKKEFAIMNDILEALKQHDLSPALAWVAAHRDVLQKQRSSLEFTVHKMQFIELLKNSNRQSCEILAAARVFEKFGGEQAHEIKRLMGCLLFLNTGLEKSPYAYLFDPILWVELCDMFARDACSLLGLPVQSPLTTVFNAGTVAVPALMAIRQALQQRQVPAIWGHSDELPVEIDLGPECQFHSIFACPILRQQTSDSNPPMRLVCGHVISKDAMTKLASTARPLVGSPRLKCPYCPVECPLTEAKQVYF